MLLKGVHLLHGEKPGCLAYLHEVLVRGRVYGHAFTPGFSAINSEIGATVLAVDGHLQERRNFQLQGSGSPSAPNHATAWNMLAYPPQGGFVNLIEV